MISTTTTLFGYGETIKGICQLSEGELRRGSLEVIAGLSAINVGSRYLESNNPNLNQYLIHTALKLGAVAVVTKGATKLIQGVQKRDLNDTLHGTLQTAVGCTTVVYLNCLDSKMITIAYQSLTILTASSYTSWQGVKDLINGEYKYGCIGLLLGATGILSAGYYVYNEMSALSMPQETPPPELDSFLKNHENEITEIYRTKNTIGNWKKLGAGVSKTAYTHPDMDFIIKIPHGKSHWGHSDSDVTIHYKHLKEAENLVKTNGYDRLKIPEAYLIQNSEGPFVVEKKFDVEKHSLDAYFDTDKNIRTILMNQFSSFIEKSGHCDISPLFNHNAGFLKQEETSIGIFDFDCNRFSTYNNLLNSFLEKTSIIISTEQTAKHIIRSDYKAVASTIGVALGITSLVYCHSEYIPFAIQVLKEFGVKTVVLYGAALAGRKLYHSGISKCKSLFGRCWKPDTSEVLELATST